MQKNSIRPEYQEYLDKRMEYLMANKLEREDIQMELGELWEFLNEEEKLIEAKRILR